MRVEVERKTLIKRLWADGLNARAIGNQIGMSKSAVLGVIHRMRAAGETVERRHKAPKKEAPKMPPILVKPPEDPAPHNERISLFDLRASDCRYPFGSMASGYTYCGAPKEKGAYCAEHYARIYRPTPRLS